MARFFAFNIFFFLLPFAAYAVYLLATRGSFRNVSEWQARTVAWLALGGSIIMVASLVYFAQYETGDAESVYVPAQFEDGRIVPGHMVSPEDAPVE